MNISFHNEAFYPNEVLVTGKKYIAWHELVTLPNQHCSDHSDVGGTGTEKGFERTPAPLDFNNSHELQNQSTLETQLQKVFFLNMVLVSPARTASYSDKIQKCGKFISALKPLMELLKFISTLSDDKSLCILSPKTRVRETQIVNTKPKQQQQKVCFQNCTTDTFHSSTGICLIDMKDLIAFFFAFSSSPCVSAFSF